MVILGIRVQLLVILFLVIVIALMTGCTDPHAHRVKQQSENPILSTLPLDISSLEPAGNGWYIYSWRQQCFLYYYQSYIENRKVLKLHDGICGQPKSVEATKLIIPSSEKVQCN